MKLNMKLVATVSVSIAIVVALIVSSMQREEVVQQAPEKPKLVAKKLNYVQSVIIPDSKKDIMVMLEEAPTAVGAFDLMAFASSITDAMVKSFSQTDEYPLPLAAHWNTGYPEVFNGLTPDMMLSLLEEGHYVLPSWHLDPYGAQSVPESYYRDSILRAAELKLPLIFVLDPMESVQVGDSTYLNLPEEESPYGLSLSGDLNEQLSPFGSDDIWEEIGTKWAESVIMQQIQALYPNPPLVMFVANRQEPKFGWSEVEQSRRYMDRYGSGRDDNFKRTLVGARWIEKFRRLEQGFKNALLSETWKANSKMLGYNGLPAEMGALPDWKERASVTNNYISLWPITEDGTTLEFHLGHWTQRDNSILSPQVRANNLPFMLADSQKEKGGYAWHLSIGDAQHLTDARRYRGFVQLGLWLLRPSVIRENAPWLTDVDETMSHFQELIDSVELVQNNGIFQRFWTQGELVANTASAHPFGQAIPTEYQDKERWFLLDVDVNPLRPWSVDSQIEVWAIAYEIGEGSAKEWMLYVQSPEGDRESVSVNIPEYGDVVVNSSVDGAFYLLKEEATAIEEPGPDEPAPGIYRQRIVYENGDPVVNARVDAIGDGWRRSDYTDENGAFEIQVVAGSTFELQADNTEYVAKCIKLLGPIASGEILENVK